MLRQEDTIEPFTVADILVTGRVHTQLRHSILHMFTLSYSSMFNCITTRGLGKSHSTYA